MIAVILRQRNNHFIMAVLGQKKIMVIIKNDHKIVAEKVRVPLKSPLLTRTYRPT